MIILRIFLFASALAYLVMTLAFIGRRNQLSRLFSLGCAAIFIYTLGYAFELGSTNLDQILFWLKFEYFGLPFVPAFWFLFAYKSLTRKEPSSLMYVGTLSMALATLFFSATNDHLHLHYRSVSFVQVDGNLIAQLVKGPWYYIFIAYSDSLILATIVLFFIQWRRSKQGWSSPSLKLFIGSVAVAVFELSYLLGLSPYNIDLTAFGFLVSAVMAMLTILKHDFLRADDLVKDVVFSGISEGILVVDTAGRISDFNMMGNKVFPWLNSDTIGTNLYRFEEGAALAACAQSGRPFIMKYPGNPGKRYFEVKAEKLEDRGKVVGKVFLFKDVTAVRKVFKRLYRLANYDTLTKVFNRRRFFDDAEKEISRVNRYGGNVSLLMLDLDNFKDLNDDHGHMAGDAVLAAVGGMLKKRVRASDIVGRYGGEEFSIVLISADEGKATIVGEDIRRNIEALKVETGGESLSATISIGVAAAAVGIKGSLTLERLLTDADRALYRAKREGRNRVCVAPAISPAPDMHQ
jgi:diguanylate cyclase (GGDEF)-like protein